MVSDSFHYMMSIPPISWPTSMADLTSDLCWRPRTPSLLFSGPGDCWWRLLEVELVLGFYACKAWANTAMDPSLLPYSQTLQLPTSFLSTPQSGSGKRSMSGRPSYVTTDARAGPLYSLGFLHQEGEAGLD